MFSSSISSSRKTEPQFSKSRDTSDFKVGPDAIQKSINSHYQSQEHFFCHPETLGLWQDHRSCSVEFFLKKSNMGTWG